MSLKANHASTCLQNHLFFLHFKRPLLIYTRLFIVTVLLIGIPLTVNGMSARPPLIPKQLEDGDYLQKSNIDSRKILIKDKNDNVKGYLQKSYIDQRKMLIFDKDGKVKGYLLRDLMDSRKLKFVKE